MALVNNKRTFLELLLHNNTNVNKGNKLRKDNISSLSSSNLFDASDDSDVQFTLSYDDGDAIVLNNTRNLNNNNERTKYRGIQGLVRLYSEPIKEVMKEVYSIDSPKEWQLRLVQLLVFSRDKALELICICRNVNSKSLPICMAATMNCGCTLVIVPLLYLGID